ncbi:unnamed protein product [Symbiodinium pilosum]|uniref:EF-hand domain-containing protein n=1 Tax=Symbiodinium pilosum TaxID=2952 RepID=A0A812ITR7_SYMPI|nr:unnamed protein product [Symbiodinium pilosum]
MEVHAEEYVDLCISRADANSDGKIDLDEFVHLLVLHLPDARIAADAEFVTNPQECLRRWSQERAQRLAKRVLKATLDRMGMQRLAICTSVTLGAGMVEAMLLVNWSHPAAFLFLLRYATEQLLPSVVWLTQDPALVANAMGYSATEILLQIDDPVEKASRLLAAGQCHAVRSVAAGFGLLGQLFRFAQITTTTRKQFDERVEKGEEPPLSSGPEERVIRLCGDFSFATYTTASRKGKYHVLPVLDPSSMRMLAEKITFGFRYPLFLGVKTKLWGQPEQKIFCLEVDGTERTEILLFGRARKIGIAQASNAFRAISAVVIQSLSKQGVDISSIRLLRVYLGDSHELAVTGPRTYFRRPVSNLLLRDQLSGDTAHVVDQVSAVKVQKSMGQPLPRLIHYPSTAETVNAAYALARLDKNSCDPKQTLILCERDWGAQQVRELNAGFQVLSAAEIIDDLLREVRQWARHGFSGREIQSELDRRDAVTLKLLRSAMHASASSVQK